MLYKFSIATSQVADIDNNNDDNDNKGGDDDNDHDDDNIKLKFDTTK